MNKTFGQKFYELRKQKNLTQEQIAERLNIFRRKLYPSGRMILLALI